MINQHRGWWSFNMFETHDIVIQSVKSMSMEYESIIELGKCKAIIETLNKKDNI